MAEVSPETAKATASQTTAVTVESSVAAKTITESVKAGDEPRETLTKIARLKQVGGYAMTGLMVIGMLSQIASTMTRESEQ